RQRSRRSRTRLVRLTLSWNELTGSGRRSRDHNTVALFHLFNSNIITQTQKAMLEVSSNLPRSPTMANPEHLAKLKEGVEAWNEWRKLNTEVRPDFSEADLGGADLHSADLSHAKLIRADLSRANLSGADLRGGNLFGADLSGTDLSEANLCRASLRRANL